MKTNHVVVEKILDSRKNPDFQGVLLSQEIEQDNLTTELLGGTQFTKKRTAIQTFAKSVIAKLNLKAGDNLCAKLGEEVKLQVIESLDEQPGFQAKVNPKTQEVLKSAGKTIYRKTQLARADEQDILVKHDVSVVVKASLV